MKRACKTFVSVAAAVIITVCVITGFLHSVYPDAMTVTEITDDLVTIESSTGNRFQFFGADDYDDGDLVAVLMFSNWTEQVTDDMILRVKYAG